MYPRKKEIWVSLHDNQTGAASKKKKIGSNSKTGGSIIVYINLPFTPNKVFFFSLLFHNLSSIFTSLSGLLDHRTSILWSFRFKKSANQDYLSILTCIKMPKDRRDRSVSIDRSWSSPYTCNTSHSRRSLTKSTLESESVKEWEEARCPVCMEHPHNAILLLCSSHEKGCRPFMCDTSYRHSNCFDQFQKASSEMQQLMDQQEGAPVTPAQTARSGIMEGGSKPALKLVCPLCRGEVNGWIVVEAARLFMNTKSRSCASETCDFSGTYTDLRKHARLVHPLVRPSEADPDRQRDWRRLERQRDIGDLLSTLQSSIGDERGEDNSTTALSFDEGGWMTVFFLIRVFRPRSSSRSSSWSGTPRARAHVTIRRRPSTRLWGETHNDEPRDDDNESSDGGSGPPDLLQNDES